MSLIYWLISWQNLKIQTNIIETAFLNGVRGDISGRRQFCKRFGLNCSKFRCY